jgi:HlyD family secretion protein
MRVLIVNAGWLLAALALAGCAAKPSGTFQGYIEGEFVYVASPLAGLLTNLAVARGLEVKAGQLLFELDREAECAAAREARERVTQARFRLENLTKGRRPSEIASLQAQLDRAKANLALSELELQRRTRLLETKVIAPEELDTVRSHRDADRAQVASFTADLETARLGARTDEIKAAEADVQASLAAVARTEWAVAQKSQGAPAAARVHDTLYRQGEFVAVGAPVVSLLPPENIKVRFFVPQPQLSLFSPGTAVSVKMDGVAAPLRATVNYVSTQAEFTPPVIYSKENRAKLVFMVEAVFAPADARPLRPGQPADVALP